MKFGPERNSRAISTTIVAIFVVIIVVIAAAIYFVTSVSPSSTTATTSSTPVTSSTTSTTPTPSTSSSASTVDVTIPEGAGNASHPNNFVPNTISVLPGTTIVFVNKDTSTHDINFTSVPSGATISPNPSPNTSQWTNNMFSVTLTVPGTYVYKSDFQFWMNGAIDVV